MEAALLWAAAETEKEDAVIYLTSAGPDPAVPKAAPLLQPAGVNPTLEPAAAAAAATAPSSDDAGAEVASPEAARSMFTRGGLRTPFLPKVVCEACDKSISIAGFNAHWNGKHRKERGPVPAKVRQQVNKYTVATRRGMCSVNP